ncbi:unnamed protein product [Callosobruchus maculatus]|uniref:Uncharacterized protein n=1 Tax=Callosobruchus maculatus TaxID=64391 RepID=A0A653DSA0_CALMS|nr:unnamed protein product [Callosobruchus maculatus]
MYISVTTGF